MCYFKPCFLYTSLCLKMPFVERSHQEQSPIMCTPSFSTGQCPPVHPTKLKVSWSPQTSTESAFIFFFSIIFCKVNKRKLKQKGYIINLFILQVEQLRSGIQKSQHMECSTENTQHADFNQVHGIRGSET